MLLESNRGTPNTWVPLERLTAKFVMSEWGIETTALGLTGVFHVKQRRQTGCRLRINSATRFCRSLGETPGILAACPRDAGRIRSSFSRAS